VRGDEDIWAYDKGRLLATLAPRHMPVKIGRQLNPAAVQVYRRHVRDIETYPYHVR
jgi:hypothetical protein